MARIRLAVNSYDRHSPLLEGLAAVSGLDFEVLEAA